MYLDVGCIRIVQCRNFCLSESESIMGDHLGHRKTFLLIEILSFSARGIAIISDVRGIDFS